MPQDQVISEPGADLTKEQCENLKAEIIDQTPQWMDLKCVEVRTKRQKA